MILLKIKLEKTISGMYETQCYHNVLLTPFKCVVNYYCKELIALCACRIMLRQQVQSDRNAIKVVWIDKYTPDNILVNLLLGDYVCKCN